ncbi:unnamed protein product [Urochloa humidicola]
MESISVTFHFGGKFSKEGKEVHYHGGRVETSSIDPDHMSFFEVDGFLKDHYPKEGTKMHWLLAEEDLSTGLRPLVNDDSCLEMLNRGVVEGGAEVYVEDPPPTGEEISDADIHGVQSKFYSRPLKRAQRIQRQDSRPLKRAERIERQINLEREFYSRPFKRAGRHSAHKEVADSSTNGSGSSFTCDPPGGMGKDDGGSKKRARVGEDDGNSKKRACIDEDDGSNKKRACRDEEDDAIRPAKRAHIDSGRSSSGGGVNNAAVDNVNLENDRVCFLSRVTPFMDDELIKVKYIVAEEKDLQTILSEIERLLKKAALSIAKGLEFSYEVPARRKLCYLANHGFVHERGELITFSFRNNFPKAIQMTCALSAIAESIKGGMSLPKRFLYYRHKGVFGSDEVAYTMLDHICRMFGCTMSSLNIFIEPVGSVIGPLEVKLKNGRTVDCSDTLDGVGQIIPRTLSIESFKHHAELILVVEKKTIFHHLLQTKFHIKHKCIMVTGSGEPDFATRSFLNRLHAATKLPVYALMDPDPFGVQILFVYAFGSVNMSYANCGLAVPDIQWIGLWHSDLHDAKLSSTYFSDTTPSERNMLENLLGHDIRLPSHWKNRMLPMFNRKASMEAMFSVGFSCLSNLLYKLIIEKASDPTQLEEATESHEIMMRDDEWEEEC